MSDTTPATRPITLGTVPVGPVVTTDARLSLLLWGDAGSGKTTLAATMAGPKLVVQFDPDGSLSIADPYYEVQCLDLSAVSPLQVIEKFRQPDPYGIGAYLRQHEEIRTVIVDSVTSYAYCALEEAVSKNQRSTLEQPGMHGYQWRNASVLRMAAGMLRLTGALGRNIIFITHEAAPDRDEEGKVLSITMALSENTANHVGLRMNEVWHVDDTGKPNERRISVRPCRQRKPMKTRMWDAKATEFSWKFDPVKKEGQTLGGWWSDWQRANGQKIQLPK